MHHEGSCCPGDLAKTCDWAAFNSAGPNANVLMGALVGGPGQDDVFADARQNEKTNEARVFYVAGSAGGATVRHVQQHWSTTSSIPAKAMPSSVLVMYACAAALTNSPVHQQRHTSHTCQEAVPLPSSPAGVAAALLQIPGLNCSGYFDKVTSRTVSARQPPSPPVKPPPKPKLPPPPPQIRSKSLNGEDDYALLVSYSWLFYEIQASGKLPEWNRALLRNGGWRSDSHLGDGADIGKDLSG